MQFGRALIRILQNIARSNPRLGPVFFSMIDISDGFYPISIRSEDVPKLAIVFPTEAGDEQLIGLPLVLPMGWNNLLPCSLQQQRQWPTWLTTSCARDKLVCRTAWMRSQKHPPFLNRTYCIPVSVLSPFHFHFSLPFFDFSHPSLSLSHGRLYRHGAAQFWSSTTRQENLVNVFVRSFATVG
jgi:hypothetical protein